MRIFKSILAAMALSVSAQANASFIVTYDSAHELPYNMGTSRGNLPKQGIEAYAVGALVTLSSAGIVQFYAYGSDASDKYGTPYGIRSEFFFPVEANRYYEGQRPVDIGMATYTAGQFQYGGAGWAVGAPAANAGPGGFTTNSLWLFYDDPYGKDGDYNDLIIRAIFNPAENFEGFETYAVPEPATWMMMIFGFGVMGAQLRLRKRETAGCV